MCPFKKLLLLPTTSTSETPHIPANDIPVNPLALRKSTRLVKNPTYLQDFHCNSVLHTNNTFTNNVVYPLSIILSYHYCTPIYQTFYCSMSIHIEPMTYKKDSHVECWNQAMKIELLTLDNNHYWSIVALHQVKVLLAASDSTILSIKLMELFKDTKHDW